MRISELPRALLRLFRLGMAIIRLPHAHLAFRRALAPAQMAAAYANFTRRHPRYKLVRNKTLGMALLPLRPFGDAASYLASVQRRDYAGYHARRAQRRGYHFRQIDRNAYIDDIHAINTSEAARQGRPMSDKYRHKTTHYDDMQHCRYYGVLDQDGRLAAYCNIGIYGNFAATDSLLGYKNRDGAMFLLLSGIVCSLIDEGQVDYLMYDTFLGAQPGLRSFKERIGFLPFRVHYSLN